MQLPAKHNKHNDFTHYEHGIWMEHYAWGAGGGGGAVAQRLERATDNRVVADSNPTEAVWKLWQFPLPHFASVFRKRH